MDKPKKSFSVAEGKIQASVLVKSLRSTTPEIANQAAKRFQRLPDLRALSCQEIIEAPPKRKYALAVIAFENHFTSWNDLKCQVPFIRNGFLTHWFVTYAEAKSYSKENGGFLLPYKNQFFICDENYIKNLGLNPDDQDWKLIGFDWACPTDPKALSRLYKSWMKIQDSRE